MARRAGIRHAAMATRTLAGAMTLYIDGRAEATRTVARGNNPRDSNFILGGSNFTGAVDEIVMYQKALDGAGLTRLEACAAPIAR
ncbi:MAG TPA: LamG-like jellyroll fold domain-containing protein [Terriglobales bacterium]